MTTKPTKLSRAQARQKAQDELMHFMMSAFYSFADNQAPAEVVEEARQQVRRVERLFGYVPGSWKD